jgi:predicted Zn-dependent protease
MTGLRSPVFAVLTALLVTAPAAAQPRTLDPRGADEREALARSQPAALEAQGRSDRGEVVPLRVRFYADDDHRAGGIGVQDRLRRTCEAINEVIEPALGVRFVVESVKSWQHNQSDSRLEARLAELERLDPARDVDWVVGLVGPLPLGSSAMHDAGMARTLGRHFVMRAMGAPGDLAAFQRTYPTLERSNPAALHMAYTQRKEHKEAVVFLHEWAHSLGGLHVEPSARTRLLSPTYGPETSVLAPVDVALLAAALKDRLGARGDIERAADAQKAQQQIAWSGLRRFLRTTRAPEWNAADRDKLLALLAGGAPAGDGAAPLTADERASYDRAFALYRTRKDQEAWKLLAPLVTAHPNAPELQPLLCRLAGLPDVRTRAQAACAAATARAAPDEAGPFIDAAQAAIAQNVPEQALAHAREAAARAERESPPDPSAWLAIAEVNAQLGALHAAEQALKHVPAGPPLDRAQAALLRGRRFFGLPPGTSLSPAQEVAYAVAFVKANDALSARKLTEARKLIDVATKPAGETPGLAMLACDLAMRKGRIPEARKKCDAALAAMEDLPRAHYLAGHLHLASDDGTRAATSFRRAIALDPNVPAFWDVLAETYTMLGREKDARALASERARALAAPP